MKCLKHLISFLLYLNLLSLCSTTRSLFNRTRRWHFLKSSVIAIEKHCFRPLKTLILAPKKMAFIQGFFRLSSILIFSFSPTSFDLLPPLISPLPHISCDVEPYLASHWLEREAKTASYFFLPKSAGTSPHWAVSHFLTSACCGCALNQLSARAIMSNKGAVFSLRSSFVLHCIFFTQRMAL